MGAAGAAQSAHQGVRRDRSGVAALPKERSGSAALVRPQVAPHRCLPSRPRPSACSSRMSLTSSRRAFTRAGSIRFRPRLAPFLFEHCVVLPHGLHTPFRNEVALELCEHRDHPKQGAAGARACVDRLVEHAQVHTLLLKLLRNWHVDPRPTSPAGRVLSRHECRPCA